MMIRTSGGRHMPAYHRPPAPKPDNPARDVVLLVVCCMTLIAALWIGGVL